MIDYRLYAFKIALDELVRPGYLSYRDAIYHHNVPDYVKNNMPEDKNPKTILFSRVELYKKRIDTLGAEATWKLLDPKEMGPIELKIINEDIAENRTEILSNNGHKIQENLERRDRVLNRKRELALQFICDNQNDPVYVDILEAMARHKKKFLPNLYLPAHKEEKVPLQWSINKEFNPFILN